MRHLAKSESAGLLFDPTRWDLIRLARGEDSAEHARRQAARALNQLCEIYRAPVLAYLRRRVTNPQDAEDLAQEFFSRRICPALLVNAEAERGRFRGLLLVSLKNFLRDHIASRDALKRGGKIRFVSLQEAASSASEGASADWSFDACWARTVLNRAMAQTRRGFEARDDLRVCDALMPFISDPAGREQLDGVARQLGTSVRTLHVRLSRLRASFAASVREELARTVASEEEIEPEIRYLLDILAASR